MKSEAHSQEVNLRPRNKNKPLPPKNTKEKPMPEKKINLFTPPSSQDSAESGYSCTDGRCTKNLKTSLYQQEKLEQIKLNQLEEKFAAQTLVNEKTNDGDIESQFQMMKITTKKQSKQVDLLIDDVSTMPDKSSVPEVFDSVEQLY